MFAAVLDTCVLWPSLQRDFLLSLAVENLYRPLWSDAILDELEFHEARKLVERGTDEAEAAQRARRLVQTMSTAFDDARVVEWEALARMHRSTDGVAVSLVVRLRVECGRG
nr:PIN domain-containing protein [Rhodococcus sp. I2R]